MPDPTDHVDTLRSALAAQGLELVETHISLVALGATEVWKIKKPVSLGFLDFGTLDKRRRACEDEVRLNRRLAADVYLGVVPVTRSSDGLRLGGEGAPVEWAVHMRRLADDDRADQRLAAGRLEADDVAQLGRAIARFHRECRSDAETARWGAPSAIAVNIDENFEQTRGKLEDFLSEPEAEEIEAWQRGFLADHAAELRRRVEQGRVRDGHGDLRLDHVYFEDRGLRIVDCIEFSDRLRYGDVCVDLAFLAMDLAWHERTDLAELLVAAYAEAANDYDLYPLLDFYESYRAFVRGKIATFTLDDPSLPEETRSRLHAEARRYFLLALASERRPLDPPRIVAIGGWIGAGKSTVAAGLARRFSSPVVAADRTRKSLLGVEPTRTVREPAFAGAYSPDATERVYREMLRRARAVVGARRGVILDASFRSRHLRGLARDLARELAVPFTFVECRTDEALLRRRLRERERTQTVSDGRLAILDDFIARWEPVDELPPGQHVVVDTGEPLEAVLDRAEKAILRAEPDGA